MVREMTATREAHTGVGVREVRWGMRTAGWRWTWLVARVSGALAVLAAGAVHLQQYRGLYSGVPTIGPLFLLDFVAATVIGVALLAPIEHLAGRFRGAAVALFTAAGIGLTGGSFVMLLVSEHGSLFGFHEPGYDPNALAAARASELAAVVLLATSLVVRFATRGRKPRW
jgi:hypothetical protein